MAEINPKKVRKLFTVSVTKRRYTEWRRTAFAEKMGGLYGLAIGAQRKRVITTRIKISIKCPTTVLSDVAKSLEAAGYERQPLHTGWRYYSDGFVKVDVVDFSGRTDEEIDRQATEYCKQVKEETVEEVTKIFVEALETFDPEVWGEEAEELMELGVLRKTR